MKKSISSRIKITKNKKTIRRQIAQGHFKAKRSSNQIRNKRQERSAHSLEKNIFKKPGTL